MTLIFWDIKHETYHVENNVTECVKTQITVGNRNRNCYALYYNNRNTVNTKFLFTSEYNLERVVIE